MEIEFVAHASCIIRAGDIALLADPWIEGTAFDNGWSLLASTPKGYEIFHDATHIWFSHEHPDHFSPPVLKRIPAEVRANLHILVIETVDKKIVGFCRSLGFAKVTELRPSCWYELSSAMSIMVGPVGDDSWCAAKSGTQVILNVNDCILRTPEALSEIKELVGQPDVLLTQFSYAQWSGNRSDTVTRAGEAARKLREVRLQAEVFQPKWLIPFASFIWFSHEENVYMNDEVNRIDKVDAFVSEQTQARPVILYPGDVWTVGHEWNSQSAIARYTSDISGLEVRKPHCDAVVPFDRLVAEFDTRMARIQKRTGRVIVIGYAVTGILPEFRAWLTDLGHATSISISGCSKSKHSEFECDVALSSAALSYFFRFDWGGNTLEVNGRYAKPPKGFYSRFHAWIMFGNDMNHLRVPSGRDILKLLFAPFYRGPAKWIWRRGKALRASLR